LAGAPHTPLTSPFAKPSRQAGRAICQSLYVSARGDRDWQIWRVPVAGGRAQQLTPAGGLGARETADGKAILFVKPSVDGLWRLDLESRQETLLAPGVVAGDWTNWDVAPDGVYFVRRNPWGRQDLLFQRFGSPAARTVVQGVRIPSATGGIALSPDGRSLLYAQFDRREADLFRVAPREGR
jgi:hypothetical protein